LLSCQPVLEDETPPPTEPDQFAIYLAASGFVFDDQIEPADIRLEDQPLVSLDDINSYTFKTHEINLTPSAEIRLSNIDLAGRPFVITINDQVIYAGEFMAAFMSRSSDRVVILWPPMENDSIMKIQLGYPGPDFFAGEDPRDDPRIQAALSKAGKLK
jgi:hypothetical protein